MADAAQRRATYQDVLSAPDHLVAELIFGQLVTHPRPALRHASVASNLGGELYGPFRKGTGGPGGWIILDEPEVHLHGDVLVPDLAGWRRERVPELPDDAAVEIVPDWVCEVLSPATAAVDRTDKMAIYAREQVRHVWLIDPLLSTLEVFRLLSEKTYEEIAAWRGDAHVRAEPFDAIELELGSLWAR